MSNDKRKDTYRESLEEFKNFQNFVKNTQETNHNFSLISKPNITLAETSIIEIQNDKIDFYTKYSKYKSTNVSKPFYLEEELAKQIKYWHSTYEEFDLGVLTLDNFFNEENVKSHLLKDTYINKNPSIVNYYLIDYILTNLEEKAFNKILIEGITTHQEEQDQLGLIGPIIDEDLIYYIINEDIDEKLNCLYKENSLGYSYIAEKIISFDLFLIYLILKNYPFYILRRERLEEIFNKVKKFKSFPYPIGSIGMDLFKLLIKELYLPGVTLFQEIRETFLLDIIDPKVSEIDCEDFIKVIAFSINNKVYGMGCEYDKNFISKLEIDDKENNKKNDENPKEKKEDNKLCSIKNFTFSAYGVYSAYILYSCDERKEEKESNYLADILNLFEKKYRAKKDDETGKENINEKNIINNIFNLIDSGLDSNFKTFIKEIITINDKLISKTKEIQDNKTNIPKDNINIRRFLTPNITFLDHDLSQKGIKRFIPKKVFLRMKSLN